MDDLLIVIRLFFLGIPCAYIVGCLLLEEKISHEGPFKQKHKYVVFRHADAHAQHVAAFDYFRRLFGVYRVEKKGFGKEEWIVQPDRAEYFSCPFCLSFWCALPLTIGAGIVYGLTPFWWLVTLFGIAAVSVITYRLMDRW